MQNLLHGFPGQGGRVGFIGKTIGEQGGLFTYERQAKQNDNWFPAIPVIHCPSIKSGEHAQRPRCLRFLEKGRENLNVSRSFGQRKQRPVHLVGMSDIQGGQHNKNDNQEGAPQKKQTILI